MRRFSRDLETVALPEELHEPALQDLAGIEIGSCESDLETLAEAFGELVELGGNV